MNYFRKPPPRFRLNGFIVVLALAVLNGALIGWVIYDAWRMFGPKP
jgi:hypothetical protein